MYDDEENSFPEQQPPAAKRMKMVISSSSTSARSNAPAPFRDQSNSHVISSCHRITSSKGMMARSKSSSPCLAKEDEDNLKDLGLNVIEEAAGDSAYISHENTHSSEKSTPPLKLSTGKELPKRLRRSSSLLSFPFRFKRKCDLTPSGPNHFKKLSDEMVIQIFRWLPKVVFTRLCVTCKRFSDIVQDESLWRRLDVGQKNLPPGTLGQIFWRGTVILRAAKATIGFPLFTGLNDKVYFSSEEKVCRLQYLDLSSAAISVEALRTLLGVCTRLRKLALENLEINHDICMAISLNPVLNTLHLGMTNGITATGCKAILRNCRQLRELNLAWINMSPDTVDTLVENLHANIERLNLSGCRDTLADKHVKKISANSRMLQELDLSDAINLSAESVVYFCRLKKLEALSTSRCYNIIPAAYLDLVECESLRCFNVYSVLKEPALTELRNRLPKIEINKFLFSSIARPTVGINRTSIWGMRVRD